MENHKQPVAPAPGAELPSEEKLAKLVKQDLLLVLATLNVIEKNPILLNHVTEYITKDLKIEKSERVNDDIYLRDLKAASALLRMVYSEAILVDQLSATLHEMQANFLQRKPFPGT